LRFFKVLRPDINRSGAGNLPVLSRPKRIELFNMFFMLMTEAMDFRGDPGIRTWSDGREN